MTYATAVILKRQAETMREFAARAGRRPPSLDLLPVTLPPQSIAFDELERLARFACELRNGPGSYSTKHRKRARYRALAAKIIADVRKGRA